MRKRWTAAFAASLVLTGLVFAGTPARAATTYDVQFGTEFGDIPAFSLRAYPSSVKLMQGDTIHFFGFGAPGLLPAGQGAQEWNEQQNARLGDEWFQLLPDPDDGAQETKFNPLYLGGFECGAAPDSPCVYDGSDPDDPLIPIGNEETGEAWVTFDVAPGTVIWGLLGSGVSPLRIEVVDDPAEASTQAELDERALKLLARDFETAHATHERFSSKQTWHRDANGDKVWDAWGGLSRGPIEFLAMYPAKLNIKKGDRVLWHFAELQNEVHTAVFSFDQAIDVINNTFVPWCDPDGDAGAGPDEVPNFEAPMEEWCADPSQVEFDLDPREVHETGNGVFNGKDSDLEASGIKGREAYTTDGLVNEDPWALRFTKSSSKKGYKYFCTIHGKFMGGKVVVKK